MRTNEERVAAMHRRAAELEKEKRGRQTRILQTVSITACFFVIVILSAMIPGISGKQIQESAADVFSASIFSGSSTLGFLAIGIIAFLLGVTVTVFCFQLKKWQEEKNSEEP